MSGLYIHIPFCRKACHFCNFHFSTSLQQKDRMLDALLSELDMRKEYLPTQNLQSIYLGGGTPSVLNTNDLGRLFSALANIYDWDEHAEITMEANPDDLNREYLNILQNSPINRLSIGLQSLNEGHLQWMNRSHTADQCRESVNSALAYGFRDMSVDWLYGYPGLKEEALIHQLEWMAELEIPHFSAYALTVEEGTVLHHRIKKGKEASWEDELSRRQFDLIMDWADRAGYEHYEISNFALPQRRAVHNSSYWKSKPYLGVGPSAHSYNGEKRHWNLANNAAYMNAILKGESVQTEETLSPKDRYNEWIMTGLRLKEGLKIDEITSQFPEFREHFHSVIEKKSISSWVKKSADDIVLTREGKHFADRVASEFFI